MQRTPTLVSAAAALGLLAGLVLEARAGTLRGEVSPHTVSVAFVTPGSFPAGVELDEGVVPPSAPHRLTRLEPMRARVPARVATEREARREIHRHRLHRKLLARGGECPRAAEEQRVELRRS